MHGQFTGTPLVDEEAGRPAHKRRKLATRRPVGNIQRLVDDFSHDIRTPLTVINEYVSLLANGPDGSNDAEQRQIVDVIADRVDDLNHAFNDFLDAIKLEAGALGVCRRKCRVVDLVAHIRPGLARKAAVRHCQFQFDVPADLPDVVCDTEQIGRVFINLATHAIKSCPQQGTVRLWATCGEQQNEVLVGVADDGQRIPSAERTTNRQRLPRGKGGSIGAASPGTSSS
jgi:signal transduction histidine kinase